MYQEKKEVILVTAEQERRKVRTLHTMGLYADACQFDDIDDME